MKVSDCAGSDDVFCLEIKEEKLVEYTGGLVRELKRTSLIAAFGKQMRGYMPKYNELKHFNPAKIAAVFIGDVSLQQQAEQVLNGGSLKSATRIGKMIAANGVSGDPSNTMTFY